MSGSKIGSSVEGQVKDVGYDLMVEYLNYEHHGEVGRRYNFDSSLYRKLNLSNRLSLGLSSYNGVGEGDGYSYGYSSYELAPAITHLFGGSDDHTLSLLSGIGMELEDEDGSRSRAETQFISLDYRYGGLRIGLSADSAYSSDNSEWESFGGSVRVRDRINIHRLGIPIFDRLNMNLRYRHSQNMDEDGTFQGRDKLELSVAPTISITDSLDLMLGATLISDSKRGTEIAPMALLKYQPADWFGVSLGLFGGAPTTSGNR